MADTGDNNSQTPWSNFNPSFLAILIVCGVLSIFFLNYFNRVFASAISYLIRLYTWHQYKIYIDIQALQVSLLGGRVFFTGFRYHGNNETILIQNGHITWSYWLWRVQDVDLGRSKDRKRAKGVRDAEKLSETAEKTAHLPCRINIAVSGLEWFIYNRSPVYSSVLAGMVDSAIVEDDNNEAHGINHPRQRLQKASHKIEEQLNKLNSKNSADQGRSEASHGERSAPNGADDVSTAASVSEYGPGSVPSSDDMPLMLQLLPIHFECEKGALVMGNENTKGVLVVKTESLSGEIDAVGCKTPDPYRQIFRIQFEHPVIEMKDNVDYKEDQLTRAVKDKQTVLHSHPLQHRSFFRRQRRRVMGKLRDIVPHWRKSVESFSAHSAHGTANIESQIPGASHWQGLSRYLNEDEEDDKLRWSSVEYAAVTTIVDSPEATLTIFWDVPGKVARDHEFLPTAAPDQQNNINGTTPPSWAINVRLGGGIVNYGPWADRHRAELQRVFNPTLSKDATPAKKLSVGADRVPTQFKFYIEVEKEVILRIPTREDSKNWKWKNEVAELRHQDRRGKDRNQKKPAATAAEQRPYGWLDVKVAANATISYSMDMLAGPTGYANTLNIELPATEVTTSVNHGTLWKSGHQHISCNLSAPLRWNSLRNWHFDIDADNLELFILRDHIFLLTDLIDDWGTGPPQDYLLFVPFKYFLNFQLRNLKLYLNVNDVNIVNNPTDFDDNTYLILSSPILKADTCITLDTFRPTKNNVPFNVRGDVVDLALHLPTWNTQSTFLTSKDFGRLESLLIDGKYHYNATTLATNTDTLVLNVSGQSPNVTLHGFLIRYFLQLKDNYFGEHVHFKTLDEYQEMLRVKNDSPEAEAARKPPHKKSNDMDVILSIRADDPKVLLPANLYSAKRHVTIESAGFAVDLRFTNYYMDLDLAVNPLSLSLGNEDDGAISPTSASSSTQMYIDGLGIYGNRLFGLPPVEPTYLCNWDLSLGAITGECTTDFLTTLANCGKSFGFLFDDDENALIPYSSIVMYDVTFLRVLVHSLHLWLHVEDAAFLLSSGQIDVNYNDWARTHYSRRADISIPDLQVACVKSESAARHRSRLHSRIETDALLKTNIRFALIGRKPEFDESRKLQQELVRREDQRTHRTEFLVLPGLLEDLVPDSVDLPAQSVPPIPQPSAIYNDDLESRTISSLGSSLRSKPLKHKSSFLSFSTASNGSILRNNSVKSFQRPAEATRREARNLQKLDELRRPAMPHREFSASRGHHSAFYGSHPHKVERPDLSHNTVAFSSQFFAPYFPLESIQPESRETCMQSIEIGAEGAVPESPQFGLEDIDPQLLSKGFAYQCFIIELPTGVSAFLNTSALRHIDALLNALQPTNPEDMLDGIQMDVMSDIFDTQKQKKVKGTIKEFVVRIPQASVRFLNCSDVDSPDPQQDEQDQYDLSLTKLALATRTEVRTTDKGEVDGNSRTSFHFQLNSIEVSAAERFADLHDTNAAVKAQISDIVASMASGDVRYIDADIGSLRTSTSSGKVEYLAALIHRTNSLGSEIGEMFSTTLSKSDHRLRQFTYQLMAEGQKAHDPSFLVRPSAVLRAASDHLRTFDSWKLMARLRQIWNTLNHDTKTNLRLKCLNDSPACPEDARQQVASAFQRWRSWDLDHIEDAVLMNRIFGKAQSSAPKTSNNQPLMLVLKIQETAFVLDPGPKQNQIYAFDITLRLQSKDPQAMEKQERSPVEAPEMLTVLNLYCSQAGIHLNWELLELVDDILRLYRKSGPETEKSKVIKAHETPSPQNLEPETPRTIQFVFALGQGSVVIETVNLKSEMESRDLAVSVLMGKKHTVAETNMILACDALTTKMRSHQQALGSCRLQKASIFVAHDLQLVNETSVHTIKATANSQDLKLKVRQDPIVLTEVLDMLVRDEVAQLWQLKAQLPASPPAEVQQSRLSERLSTFRVNLALFLDSYTITIPLLRSLTYTIEGVVARAAMAANFGKEIIFDFDIKENSHNIQIGINNALRSISLLRIPPTNGRIESQMAQGEHSITVFASVELIQLDASAVYSMLAALNRPEMSNAINDLQDQVKIVQEHAQEIFGVADTVKEAPLKASEQTLVYSVHATLAGLEIFGQAPLKSDTDPTAHLSFYLSSVHLELANQLELNGPILDSPEVHINLRQIMFDISKGSDESNMQSSGNLSFGALITATNREAEDGTDKRFFDFRSDGFEVNLSADTVSTFVDVLGYMGNKIKDLDTTKEIEYLQRRLRQSRPRIAINDQEQEETDSDIFDSFLATAMYSFEISNIHFTWLVAPGSEAHIVGQEDLVLSFHRIEFATRKKNTAKLTIEDFQLQMVPPGDDKIQRSVNSALLPEIIFNVAFVSTVDTRRLAFQAVGKSLDLRLNSAFIVPAANLINSISLSVKNVQQASKNWTPIVATDKPSAPVADTRQQSLFGGKRFESLLIDADFAGAVVHLSSKKHTSDSSAPFTRQVLAGKYGQFSADDSGSSTVLRTPGLAWKIEYRDDGKEDPAVYGEIKVDASRNILYPSIVPLIMDISSSIKEVVSDRSKEPLTPTTPASKSSQESSAKQKNSEEENILTADPSAVLGRTKLNIGLRIRKQEFTLSCQPIARVAATARFDDIYVTVNTVHSVDHGNFFAVSGTFSNLQTSVQHVYSREHTGRFEVESLVLSLMNSKHVSGTSGVSAILKVSPMKVDINAKQLQDFLLFREIWYPREVQLATSAPVAPLSAEAIQGHLVQRYQQVAATAAFPWTATISIASLDVNVDLGQSLGKSVFAISDFWVSSKKTSDWEQNLCLGFQKIGIDCTGRLSGFVALQNFKLRTSIEWPEREAALNETPRIQASVGFSQFRLKAAFDYQAFLVADITSLEFLMYNVRQRREGSGDRLVAIFDGEAVQIFGITTSAAQAVALWQAIQRLIQERKANYESSLRDIEKFMKRRSLATQGSTVHGSPSKPEKDVVETKSPISLDTDVVVTLKALNLGIFPSAFSDHQVLKLEAMNAQARFAASLEQRRIHSILGLTLGQLRIGLAGVRRESAPKAVSEISVEDVVASATGSRGGTILKVPKVEAIMQTWQRPESRTIDYIFKSAFEGKVEVGWNYSRISYIRGMWANHSKMLATTWGRALPEMSAIKVTGVPELPEGDANLDAPQEKQQTKITAEVNVPQSKYEYVALEPPIIETPQLRDMGEATPPLEWIGLHRDRLPNLTHQIVIVSLLELAGEVEDAYERILGSS
ncbi:hypothetical protein BX600DRAFT_13663 [Xylariales sp. PMI_506]|nr:hypothetical protein BX600DRAFT_13663 [Xylariales sp. PMI_506]